MCFVVVFFVKLQTAEIIVRNNKTGHDIELVADRSLKERVSRVLLA